MKKAIVASLSLVLLLSAVASTVKSQPIMAVSPDSLAKILFTGTVATDTLTIINTGDSDLSFVITIQSSGAFSRSLGDSLENVYTNSEKVILDKSLQEKSANPSGALSENMQWSSPLDPTQVFNSSKLSKGISVSAVNTTPLPFYESFEDGNYSGWTDDYGTGLREVTNATAAHGQYSFHYQNTTSGAHFQGIHRDFDPGSRPEYVGFYVRSGSTTLADAYFVLGDVDDAIFFIALDNGRFYVNENQNFPYAANQWYFVEFRDIDWTGKHFDYYVNGSLVASNIPFRNASSVNQFSRLYLYNYHSSNGWWDGISVGSGVSWLAADYISGTVPAGTSTQIGLTYDATGLNGGDYLADIIISSNDPANPEDTVPVSLTVIGTPNIVLSDDTLNYGDVYIGSPDTLTLRISNNGTDLLEVSSISSNNPRFTTLGATIFSVPPGQFQDVRVQFLPTGVGLQTGTLSIASSDSTDPTVTVQLIGSGIYPPVMGVSPDSLALTLFEDDSAETTITINNSGLGTLDFEISHSFVSVSSTSKLSGLAGEALAIDSSIRILTMSNPVLLQGLQLPYNLVSAAVFDTINLFNFDLLYVGSNPYLPPLLNRSADIAAFVNAGGGIVALYNGNFNGWQWLPVSVTQIAGYCNDLIHIVDTAHPAMDSMSDAGLSNWGCSYHGVFTGFDPLLHPLAVGVDASNQPVILAGEVQAGRVYIAGMDNDNHTYRPETYTMVGKAIAWASGSNWLFENPTSGSVPPISSAAVTVKVKTDHLDGGTFLANILINSNDPANSQDTVPVSLMVIGSPNIVLSDDTLNFGENFVGYPDTLSLRISNNGSDLLEVTGINSDNPRFTTLDATIFNVPQGEFQDVRVQFLPTGVGLQTGTLSIASSDSTDPTVTVQLIGTGIHPPEISVSPDSLDEDLFTGQTSQQLFHISNAGGLTDLNWAINLAFMGMTTSEISSPIFSSRPIEPKNNETTPISMERPNLADIYAFPNSSNTDTTDLPTAPINSTSLQQILDSLNFGFAAVTAVIPNRYNFSEGASGYYIDDGGGDMYDGGNVLSTNLGGPLNYSDNVILNSAALGSGGKYFTRKYQGLFVMAADMEGVSFFQLTGNVGADGFGNVDGAILETTLNGISYRGFVKRVYNAGDPSVNHLIIVEDDPLVTHEFTTNTDDDYHRIMNMSGVTRIYYLLYAGGNGFYIDNASTLNIMNTFLNTLHLLPGWVSVSPNTGTIPAGGNQIIDVSFDATGLNGGDYLANLFVESNDPDEPSVRVPAHLHVTGAPDIAVSPDSIDFGALFIGALKTDTALVENIGTDVLIVTGVSSNYSDFVPGITSFTLNPGDGMSVPVVFTPSTASLISGLLSFSSNDPNMPIVSVVLNGQGLIPPVIDVTPDSLTANLILTVNPVEVESLSIANIGGSNLNWEILFNSNGDSNKTLYTLTIPAPSNDTANPERPSGNQNLVLPDARPFAIQAYLDDLTGVHILFDQYRGGGYSSNWYTMISDLQSRGAIVTVHSSTITSAVLQNIDIVWTFDMYNFSWAASEIDALKNWLLAGGGLLIESDEYVNEYNSILATLGAGIQYAFGGYAGYTSNIFPHETTVGVGSIYLGGPVSHLSTVTSPAAPLVDDFIGDCNTAYRQIGNGRIVVMADENFIDWSIGTANNQLFGNQVFDWLANTVDWLSVAPDGGITPPGAATVLTVTIDGHELLAGDYSGMISIFSNDPLSPVRNVPVDIHVLEYLCGDVSGDGIVDRLDLTFINYAYFFCGPSPIPPASADLNCNNRIDLSDLQQLESYLDGNGTLDCCTGSASAPRSQVLERINWIKNSERR